MKEINNLIYSLEINYTNNSQLNTSISIKLHDNGLETMSVKVGNVCITEETLNGRVFSGRFDNSDGYCGYKYDYQNRENLLNINPNIPIDTATSLINTTKMKSDFLLAKLVLSSISRNDYRVVVLDKGSLNIIKTISAENEKSENCSLQESIDLLKLDGAESFIEQHKKRVYKIDDIVVEGDKLLADEDIKLQLNELSYIISQNPHSYKDLIELKTKLQSIASNSYVYNTNNEEKML
jgi:hypothetical protein